MRIGIQKLDEQHQTLIEMLNRVIRTVELDQAGERSQEVLKFMRKYAASHFVFEEDCMNRHHCPAAAANKQAHEDFVRAVTDFDTRLRSEGVSEALAMDMERFLAAWVIDHIAGLDHELAGCVRNGN